MTSVRNQFTCYTVSYNSENHWSVITQMWGSQWPKVLPYCLINVGILLVLVFIGNTFGYRYIEISPQGHSFITMVVAFLLVSRVNTGLTRYNTARDAIGVMHRATRDVVLSSTVFSNTCDDEAAKEWRSEVAYRAMMLLRTATAVVEYPDTLVPPWDIPELNGLEAEDVRNNLFMQGGNNARWAHNSHSEWEESMRVPVRLTYLLSKTLHGQKKRLREEINVTQENKLLACLDTFMVGYYGIRKFLTTPVPFPLIQMARTFMFLFVFTVPFAMLGDKSSTLAHCFMVFVLTYGFIGLEVVAIELDNPFGRDPNDFNISAMAMTVYEDVYLFINDLDGPEAADQLRARMRDGSADNPMAATEQTQLLSKPNMV